MTANSLLQLGVYLGMLLVLVKPLGWYMAQVFESRPAWLNTFGRPIENLIYHIARVKDSEEMRWTQYAAAVLLFNVLGFIAVYALQRLQGVLPLNPQGLGAVSPDSSFNTAISFATNTNWQGYGGESTMGYLTQMVGLAVQNFFSAATGIAVVIAMIRGFARHTAQSIGNFWVDLTRTTLYVLLPLSTLLAVLLISQGMIQNFDAYQTVPLMESVSYEQPKIDESNNPILDADGRPVKETVTIKEQTLAMGPVASQIAIKQLGTNGGGYFNTNSAHPYENPTPLTNFLEMLAILLIPAALTYTFGKMVGDTRQGWAVLAAMTVIFVALLVPCVIMEQQGNSALTPVGVDQQASALQAGGNMEGKETRFGIANSALWATATTAASNGSVNSMHDSYTPLGGLVPMWLIQLGEVVFGSVGSGLYGTLVFAIIAVFVAGLMIGRTLEYLGKKIEAFEMKMASIVILIPPLLVLAGTAVAVLIEPGKTSIFNPRAHGFSEVLYAFSASNNNGSAFAGLSANTPFYNTALGLAMWFGRFWLLVAVLAIAGSLAAKKRATPGVGTLPTHGPLFIAWLVGIVLMVGALTFLPALALGPIVEHLNMASAP
jgi:potassium-transporting ATPase potassium-binding subunit